jgi:hypothetical protein
MRARQRKQRGEAGEEQGSGQRVFDEGGGKRDALGRG